MEREVHFLRAFTVAAGLFCAVLFLSAFALQGQDYPLSPKLVALQKELRAGNRVALGDFWKEVVKQGAPVVEPVQGDSQYVLVTFLWRAKEETRNVVVWSDLGSWQNLASLQMVHLPDSDVWYKTYRVRNDARFIYRLTVNDPLTSSLDDGRKNLTYLSDPLNPKNFIQNGKPVYSIVELPAAPPLTWIKPQPDVLKGEVRRLGFRSTILKNDRRVWVYTPPGYALTSGPYHLLILFDGSSYVNTIPAATVLDNLLAKGLIPPTVAVLIDSINSEVRFRELTCYPPFDDFLIKEMLPWVHQNYHVTAEPSQIIVGGASFGGLAATCVAFRHPEVFGNVLSQSGSFWWKPEDDSEYEWLTRQFVASSKLRLRFYLEVGLLENINPPREDSPTNLVANRHLRDVLQAKGYSVRFQEVSGGHDYFPWQSTLADGVLALMGKVVLK